MRAALLITAKDLRSRLRDRSALIVGIVVPLGLAFIFNLIFGGLSTGSGVIKLGVVDQDRGAVAQAFTGDVLGAVARQGLVSIRTEGSPEAAQRLVAAGTLNAAIVIPAGFSDSVQAGRSAQMRVIGNADSPISTSVARSIAEGYAAELNRIALSVMAVQAGTPVPLSAAQLGAVAAEAAHTQAPIAIRDVSSSNKQLDMKSFYAAGMAVFFLFFTVQFGVLGLLEERNDGTLSRLIAAPISRRSILAAKLMTSFAMGVLSMGVLVVATTFLFGASWGNPIGVAILIVSAVLAATSVVGVVAGFARSAEEASNWQAVIALVLGMLGGAFFPVSQAQGFLAQVTYVAPQAWFMQGLADLRGGDLSAVWVPSLAMLAFALVAGTLAMTRLRHLAEV